MRPMSAYIVDDEPPAVRRMELLLRGLPGVTLAGAETNGARALEAIAASRPDLLFLDIAMPPPDGFALVAALPGGYAPAIVFVTAHDAHALQAFDAAAVDYLMKPVAAERLQVAVERARAFAAGRGRPGAAAFAECFWVQRLREFARVPVAAILWIGAEGDYVRLHTAGGGGGMVRATMAAVEARLDPALFVRVHRSAIVRRSEIVAIARRPSGALTARLARGGEVPVGRSYGKGLRAMVDRVAGP